MGLLRVYYGFFTGSFNTICVVFVYYLYRPFFHGRSTDIFFASVKFATAKSAKSAKIRTFRTCALCYLTYFLLKFSVSNSL